MQHVLVLDHVCAQIEIIYLLLNVSINKMLHVSVRAQPSWGLSTCFSLFTRPWQQLQFIRMEGENLSLPTSLSLTVQRLQHLQMLRLRLVRGKKIFGCHIGYVGRMSGGVFGY
jgi:hypothetical protein